MILHPPNIVPSVIALEQYIITHKGIVNVLVWCEAKSIIPIIAIPFWASLAPCEKPSQATVKYCDIIKNFLILIVNLRKIIIKIFKRKKPTIKPKIGDKNNPAITFKSPSKCPLLRASIPQFIF